MPAKKKTAKSKKAEAEGEGGGEASPEAPASPAASPPSSPTSPAKASKSRVHVYARVRPRNKRENELKMATILEDVRDPKVLHLTTGKNWGFDGVLYDDSTQPQAFQMMMTKTMQAVLSGKTAAALCYGQTGTGKTFTMRGTDDLPGLIPRVADYIFKADAADSGTKYEVQLSYIQVYLGKPRDLLEPKKKEEPSFVLDGDNLIFKNLSVHTVTSAKQFMKLTDGGEKYKVVRATMMNADSSRGHSAMIIDVKMIGSGLDGTKHGKLFLVDLAGYEQAALIGQGSNELMQETRHINETLLGLNRVMTALARGEKRIPYREYNLCLMLKDALGHKCESSVIITVSPGLDYKQQTYNTLHFGKSAMSVEVKATIGVIHDFKAYCQVLQQKLTAAQQTTMNLASWMKKTHPKELKRFETAYGKIEIADESAVLEAMSQMGATAVEDDGGGDDDMENEGGDDSAQNALERINLKFARRQRRDETNFTKELQILKAQQAEELQEMISSGADEVKIRKLKAEHAYEERQLEIREQEHRLHVNEQFKEEQGRAMMKFAVRLKVIGSRAKKMVAHRSMSNLKRQESMASGGSGSFTAGDGMEVSTSDDVIQLMKSAPTVDGGSVTFADSAMEAQEQADKAAYLGDITGTEEEHEAATKIQGRWLAKKGPSALKKSGEPQVIEEPATITPSGPPPSQHSQLSVEVQIDHESGTMKVIQDLFSAAVALAETSGEPDCFNRLIADYYLKKGQGAVQEPVVDIKPSPRASVGSTSNSTPAISASPAASLTSLGASLTSPGASSLSPYPFSSGISGMSMPTGMATMTSGGMSTVTSGGMSTVTSGMSSYPGMSFSSPMLGAYSISSTYSGSPRLATYPTSAAFPSVGL
jgi:hypothetical protein|uniref:Kinesin motor domain-containing protein n=1 Tax=Eutreptiella gymnastica TaxID=73025 RepID=A0A7S4LCB0_9EUGL